MLNAGERITNGMLQMAARLNDIDDAVKSVMDQVGIDDGGVADMEIGDKRAVWYDATYVERFNWLSQWREAEVALNFEYPMHTKE